MRRVISLQLPHWPSDRLRRASKDAPSSLVRIGPKQQEGTIIRRFIAQYMKSESSIEGCQPMIRLKKFGGLSIS
jgi:hypothetical protein